VAESLFIPDQNEELTKVVLIKNGSKLFR